jgi:hypothetical protein
MTADKIKNGNTPNRGGRPKGSVNKTTATAKAMIEEAAAGLGGAERMLAWAKEAPENEKAFWTQVFPKLMPLQVNGPGKDGEHKLEVVIQRFSG